MSDNIKGSYIKAYGGDFGLFWNGKSWISFQCVGCEIARGNIIPSLRLNNADHPRLMNRVGYNFQFRHDPELHNNWLRQGKEHKNG